MARTPSPLRYPGGKTAILPMVSQLIKDNDLERGHYVEPYAGGCGLALPLMFGGFVHDIHLNDIDRSIWTFWNAVINNTDQLVEKIIKTPVTMDEWHKQRFIQQNKDAATDFDLGFSSFFLNRTNRSGIILRAGVIGGLNQSGNYKLDCRFNKESLIKKIRRIEKYKHRIHLYNCDAVEFINSSNDFLPENSFYCIDPPYYNKGSLLYTNFYQPDDHSFLSNAILNLERPWILTYDNADEIKKLYKKRRQYLFDIKYVAAVKRVGTELMVVSKRFKVSDAEALRGLRKCA